MITGSFISAPLLIPHGTSPRVREALQNVEGRFGAIGQGEEAAPRGLAFASGGSRAGSGAAVSGVAESGRAGAAALPPAEREAFWTILADWCARNLAEISGRAASRQVST